MKKDIFDFDYSWLKKKKHYWWWSPSPETPEIPAPISAPEVGLKKPEPARSSIFTCPKCGAMMFLKTAKCGVCRAVLPEVEPAVKPKKKRRSLKMSFKDFEAAKIRLNRLKDEWYRLVVSEPKSRRVKKLERKINDLKKQLEANLRLVFLFEAK